MVVLFGAVTVWFNVERVPAEWRMVSALPPVAGIFMTLLIAFLLKVFARVTGKAMTFDAPPPAVGTVGALQATAVRLPDGSYGCRETRSRAMARARSHRRARSGICQAQVRPETGIPDSGSWTRRASALRSKCTFPG